VEGLVLGSYEFHWRSEGPKEQPVRQAVLAGIVDPDSRKDAVARALAVAGAGWQSRTLALVPSNLKTPAWLAEQAEETARRSGLDIKVWDEQQLADDGFGGIAGVGQASANPPRLVRLEYAPRRGARKAPHVVLVGKGITFDTGGLSIKPREARASRSTPAGCRSSPATT
jgi:leucyl aminopeptidase